MRYWLAFAAFNGMIGVVVGAVGSHALKASLTPERLAWLDTAMRYQMWHALALAAVAVLMAIAPAAPPPLTLRAAACGFSGGLVLFSFGLYAMALLGLGSLGPVVPTGGLLYIAGWLSLLIYTVTAP